MQLFAAAYLACPCISGDREVSIGGAEDTDCTLPVFSCYGRGTPDDRAASRMTYTRDRTPTTACQKVHGMGDRPSARANLRSDD